MCTRAIRLVGSTLRILRIAPTEHAGDVTQVSNREVNTLLLNRLWLMAANKAGREDLTEAKWLRVRCQHKSGTKHPAQGFSGVEYPSHRVPVRGYGYLGEFDRLIRSWQNCRHACRLPWSAMLRRQGRRELSAGGRPSFCGGGCFWRTSKTCVLGIGARSLAIWGQPDGGSRQVGRGE